MNHVVPLVILPIFGDNCMSMTHVLYDQIKETKKRI